MTGKKALIYLSAISAMVCWAFSFVWVKVAYIAYGPITTIFFRLLIASAIMILYSRLTRQLLPIKTEDYGSFLLLAFFEPFLYFMGESYGLKFISSTMAAVIIATIPLFSPLAASKFHGESLPFRNLIGIILSFLGVSLVVFDSSVQFKASPLGVALEFLAVASAIAYTVVLVKLTKKYNTPTIITTQNFIGIFYFLPFWLIFECSDFINTPYDPAAMGAIIKLAVFASVLGFVFFTFTLKNLGINVSNMFINMIPVLTAIFSWYILGDPLTVTKMIGIAIVVSGLFIAQLKMKKTTADLISIQQDGGR